MRTFFIDYFRAFCFILIASIFSAFNVHAQCSGKHSENVESWSVFYRLDKPDRHPLYVGMFFISGKLYFLNGNFSHIFWLDTSSGEYRDQSEVYWPLIESVCHDARALNEKFGDSTISYHEATHTIDMKADFSEFCCDLKLELEKKHVEFKNIFQQPPADLKSDWYLFPRVKVHAETHKAYSIQGDGIGHFQHYWGHKVSENGDWMVLHLDSGRDVIICNLLPDSLKLDWLPGDYIDMISEAGGQQLIRKFKYEVLEWWESAGTHKKYPVKISIKAPEDHLSMVVTAIKKNQTSHMVGIEKWFGFVDVSATIDGKPDSGWGFMTPIGVKAKAR